MPKSNTGDQKNTDSMVQILGVRVISTSLKTVLAKIDQICHSSLNPPTGGPFLIATVGSEFVVMAQHDPEFARILNAADLSLPDGVGLKLAKPDLQIIPGRKLVSSLVHNNYRIFYLGGRDGVAQKMADKYGGMADAGHYNVKIQDTRYKIQTEEIISKINSFKPDILLVAYGAPYQEKWLWANRKLLKAKVIMGVGGSFDYLTGYAALPPEWVSKIGFEWAWRLVREPWRWRRQLRLVEFVLIIVRSRFFRE